MDFESLKAPSWLAYILARFVTSVDYCFWVVTFGPIRRLLSKGVSKDVRPVMVKPPSDTLYTGIWRSAKAKDSFLEGPEWSPNSPSLFELFKEAAGNYPSKNCFGIRPIIGEESVGERFPAKVFAPTQYLSYSDVLKRVNQFAASLHSIGCKEQPPVGTFAESSGNFSIVLYESSCPEWTIASLAAYSLGMVAATVFATLGIDAVATAFADGGGSVLLCNRAQVAAILKLEIPTLKTIVYSEWGFSEDQKKIPLDLPDSKKVKVYSFTDFLALASKPAPAVKVTRDHMAVVMYTSGSTGKPKGVMIKHGNILSMIAMGPVMLGPDGLKNKQHVSYLPSAHIFELMIQVMFMSVGSCICFADPKTLSSLLAKPHGALEEFKPEILMGVPKIYDVFMKNAQSKISQLSPTLKYVLEFSLATKIKNMADHVGTPLLDFIFFRKIAANLGGRARLAISGGGPLAPDCMRFCSAAFSLQMFQGYGLTETCASAALQPVEDGRTNLAGFPTACSEIRLRSCVSDSGEFEALDKAGNPYLATDTHDHSGRRVQGRGEVQIRGPAVAAGYYRNPKLTAEAFTADGWFRTGDIGAILSDGALEIVDRLKNLVKLRTGEYIALENMELVYSQSELIDPIAGGLCCYGDGDMDRPVALVHIAKAGLANIAKKLGLDVPPEKLVTLTAVKDAVRQSLDARWKAAGLYPIEKIAAVEIMLKPWTAEEGSLTATNKISRHGIARIYKDTINRLKAELASVKN